MLPGSKRSYIQGVSLPSKTLVPPARFELATSALGKCAKAEYFRICRVFAVCKVSKKAFWGEVCCRNAASGFSVCLACGDGGQNSHVQPG